MSNKLRTVLRVALFVITGPCIIVGLIAGAAYIGLWFGWNWIQETI
jgi:hypothetical protein